MDSWNEARFGRFITRVGLAKGVGMKCILITNKCHKGFEMIKSTEAVKLGLN
jgi:hypothetical protein